MSTKRQRFEIFKRDEFRCVYCGRKPPEVLLEVDHIIPKVSGGSDASANLLTACFDCNRGKADVPLSELPHGHQETIEQRREKLEQLRAISQLCVEEEAEYERLFQIVSARWLTLEDDDPDEYCLAGEPARAVRMFLKLLPANEILQCLESAQAKFAERSQHSMFKYFCGCCWRKIKGVTPLSGESKPSQSPTPFSQVSLKTQFPSEGQPLDTMAAAEPASSTASHLAPAASSSANLTGTTPLGTVLRNSLETRSRHRTKNGDGSDSLETPTGNTP